MSLEMIKIRTVEVGECWEWASTGAKATSTKPWLRLQGKNVSARRHGYELVYGQIRDGHCVTPAKCKNPKCINPEHQRCMTRSACTMFWAAEGKVSGLSPKKTAAARARSSRMSIEIAREIRQSSLSNVALGKRFGVSGESIRLIRKGAMWVDHANPFSGLMRAA